MTTIVTHTFLCEDCFNTTELHLEDGADVVTPQCEHCDSSNMSKED